MKNSCDHNDSITFKRPSPQGLHEFGSSWTAQYDPAGDQAVSFTGSGLASMALGLSTQLTAQANRGFLYFRQKGVLPSMLASWAKRGLTWTTAEQAGLSSVTTGDGNRWPHFRPYSAWAGQAAKSL